MGEHASSNMIVLCFFSAFAFQTCIDLFAEKISSTKIESRATVRNPLTATCDGSTFRRAREFETRRLNHSWGAAA